LGLGLGFTGQFGCHGVLEAGGVLGSVGAHHSQALA